MYTVGSASDNRNTGRTGSDGAEPYGKRNGDGDRRSKSGKYIGGNGSGICDGNRSADIDRGRDGGCGRRFGESVDRDGGDRSSRGDRSGRGNREDRGDRRDGSSREDRALKGIRHCGRGSVGRRPAGGYLHEQ